ncbi:MAG: hypothetical protein JRG83_02685 [Deltaproteobacteria bacterium]|nr:hypothetical protein [Deltaproteobacteria bacterium]
MLRWFYIGLGCLVVASMIYLESVRRTGQEPGALVGMPELALPELRVITGGAPVLVFHVGNPEAVARVRAAVSPERIVAETPSGFALREGRVVSAGHDATATLLTEAGWTDRPLAIHRAEPRLPDYRGGIARAGARGGKASNALAHKSHLTQREAMAVIESLD